MTIIFDQVQVKFANMKGLLVRLVVVLALFHCCFSIEFNYTDHKAWGGQFPACNGKKQSPINIDSDNAKIKNFPSLQIQNFDRELGNVTLQHDGYKFKITGNFPVTMQGGPFLDKYKLVHFHYHWGQSNNVGAEHLINSKSGALEVHAVFYNTKYASFDDAVAKTKGIAVIGVIYNVHKHHHQYLQPIVIGLKYVIANGTTAQINVRPSLRNILDDNLKHYFTYEGSLTTPPCYETVTWIVAVKTGRVSAEQINAFRQLKAPDGRPIANYRPVLPLKGRIVYKSHYLLN